MQQAAFLTTRRPEHTKKAVIRENLTGRVAGAGDGRRPCRAIAAPCRPMPRHNEQESSDRTALSSPAGTSPTGADGVFVPNNGVITLNLNHPPTEKKTEGLQYQQVPNEPRKGRVSGLKKAVFRVLCLVIRENLGIRAGLRLAPGNGLVSGLGSRKYLKRRGLGGFAVASRRVPDGRG